MGRSSSAIRRSRLDLVTNWEQRIKDANYKLTTLARNLHISPRHLRRYIQETIGRRPHEWFTELRFHGVPGLLQDGKSVKETAAIARFKTSSHFSHAFKKTFGLAPTTILIPDIL